MGSVWWAIRREPLRRLARLARAVNARNRRRGRPEIVFMGDSITNFWIDNDPGLFLWRSVNVGINGETSREMRARFDADVVALRPRAVHIMAGTNDLWHGVPGEDAAIALANIAAMVEAARGAGIAVILAALPPFSAEAAGQFGHPELYETLRTGIARIARDKSPVHVDYARSLTGADGTLVVRYTTDGVHLTTAGYRAMRAQARQAIRAALA